MERRCKKIYHATMFSKVIRVLGVLGALDPHKHRMNLGLIKDSETGVSKSENKMGGQDAANGGDGL